ncbi:hypothetical protein HanRHA438_Chr08g0346551 [Helianthus annuus]|nr:hypothetical protein HanRHA438_Chr08g0346551 [Helianthus annuus]
MSRCVSKVKKCVFFFHFCFFLLNPVLHLCKDWFFVEKGRVFCDGYVLKQVENEMSRCNNKVKQCVCFLVGG